MYLLTGKRGRKTKKCQRCGLHHPFKDEQCYRCHGLGDVQLQQALAERGRQLDGTKRKVIILLVVFVLAVLLFFSWDKP